MEYFVYAVKVEDKTTSYLSCLSTVQAQNTGLPVEAIVGEVIDTDKQLVKENINLNKAFIDFLHQVIEKHSKADLDFLAEAKRIGKGSVSVLDRRTPTPKDGVPAEDIIGIFEIEDGEPKLYHANPNYLPCGKNGLLQLDEKLFKCWLDEITNLKPTGS